MGLIVSELTSCLAAEKENRAWLRKAQLHMMSASSPAKIATIADILDAHKNKMIAFVLDIYTTLTHSLDTGLFHNKKILSSTHHAAFSFNNSCPLRV